MEPSFEIMMKMMKYRGFDIKSDIEFSNPMSLFKNTFETKIYWLDKCGISHLKKILTEITDKSQIVFLYIVINSITSYANAAISLLDKRIKIKILYRNKYLINILDNSLVDRHVICTESEKEKVCQEFGVDQKKITEFFPKILLEDPMVEYIGANLKDLVKIYRRDDDGNITSLYYRVVVDQ
jgi:DNA-directed RNA polymerase subunit H (RpoH/RPB5)